MRFADSSARTTGLGGAVAEGMVSYLQDTDAVEVYDGSAWLPVTGIRQIVSATTTTATNTTSASFGATSLTASITPSNAANEVVVLVQIEAQTNSSNGGGATTTIYRGASQLNVQAYVHNDDANDLTVGQTLIVKDSPATTSATTYTVHLRRDGGTGTASVEGRQNILLVEVSP